MRYSGHDGKYVPSFNIIEIKYNFVDPDVGFESDGNFVFAHELTHYLQDFCTLIGLASTAHIVNQIAHARHVHGVNESLKEGDLELPLDTKYDLYDYNSELLNRYAGDRHDRHANLSHDYNLEIATVHAAGHGVQQVTLISEETGKSFVVGAEDLLEAMADAVERCLGSNRAVDDLPYKADLFILKSIGIDTDALQPFSRLLLLETALACVYSAAPFYYELVNDIAKKSISLNDHSALRRFLNSVGTKDRSSGTLTDLTTLYASFAGTQRNMQAILQNGIQGRNHPYERLAELVDCAARRSYPIASMVEHANGHAWSFCQNATTKYFPPAVFDSQGEIIGPDGNDTSPIVLPVVYTFFKIITRSNRIKCDLHAYCCKKHPDLTTEECKTAPWKRNALDKRYDCEFSRAMVANGIAKKNITLRSSK
jgi:hypothetical protein